MNNDKLTELVNFHQKETTLDGLLSVEFTKLQPNEIVNTFTKHGKIFTDVSGKSNVIGHKSDTALLGITKVQSDLRRSHSHMPSRKISQRNFEIPLVQKLFSGQNHY